MVIRDEEMAGEQEEKIHDHLSSDDLGSPCSEGSSDDGHKSKEVRKNNVSELVAKSKKAASSLWTLLHAKVR
jgi:hypothetical protein